jgi:hypothetical protein
MEMYLMGIGAIAHITLGCGAATALLLWLKPAFAAITMALNSIRQEGGMHKLLVPWEVAIIPACLLYALVFITAIWAWPSVFGAMR